MERYQIKEIVSIFGGSRCLHSIVGILGESVLLFASTNQTALVGLTKVLKHALQQNLHRVWSVNANNSVQPNLICLYCFQWFTLLVLFISIHPVFCSFLIYVLLSLLLADSSLCKTLVWRRAPHRWGRLCSGCSCRWAPEVFNWEECAGAVRRGGRGLHAWVPCWHEAGYVFPPAAAKTYAGFQRLNPGRLLNCSRVFRIRTKKLFIPEYIVYVVTATAHRQSKIKYNNKRISLMLVLIESN